MNKGIRATFSLVVILLCLQTALAQQSAAPSKRAPQLTDEDLRPATAPMLAEEGATAQPAAGGSRHRFGDLGLSFEFAGNPPAPTTLQMKMPESPLFKPDVKAQSFHGNGWRVMALRITSLSSPSVNILTAFANGFAKSYGVSDYECAPESGANPGVRITGIINRGNETRDFKGRLITLDQNLWMITVECRQSMASGCSEALQIFNSTKPAP